MNEDLHHTLTALLDELGTDDPAKWSHVLPAVYEQLKNVARNVAGPNAASDTITPTALVHDAWAKLANSPDLHFADREHFFAVAAVTMRHLLVDGARRRAAAKRGGGKERVTLSEVEAGDRGVDVVELDDALRELETLSPRQARIAELRFFAGLSVPEVARSLGVSVTTIEADWRLARAWLGHKM